MKISIIIPCYSVGKELVEIAIDSVKGQTYSNWEIIFVDDCSPLQEWKSEKLNSIPKEKLKIINNEKSIGAGECRNIAIDKSSGELILFLDADDKYSRNDFFKYLIEKFEKYPDLDLVLFDHIRFSNWNKSLEDKIKNEIKDIYYRNINFETFIGQIGKIGVWLCLKKKFIKENNIKFKKRGPSEDTFFLYQVIWQNPNLLFTKFPFYLWRERKDSTTDKLISKKYYEIKNINMIVKDINGLQLKNNNEDIYIYISRFLLTSLLKYGYKRNKKYLNIEINKDICKWLYKKVRSWDWPKMNMLIRFKLKWAVSILYRIYYCFK